MDGCAGDLSGGMVTDIPGATADGIGRMGAAAAGRGDGGALEGVYVGGRRRAKGEMALSAYR